MVAANRPQAAATATSRRCNGSLGVLLGVSGLMASADLRLVQNARPLHQGDDIEQDGERAERERNGDRARALLALLLLGQDDPFGLVVRHLAPHATAWPGRPPQTPSIRSTAKRTKR